MDGSFKVSAWAGGAMAATALAATVAAAETPGNAGRLQGPAAVAAPTVIIGTQDGLVGFECVTRMMPTENHSFVQAEVCGPVMPPEPAAAAGREQEK